LPSEVKNASEYAGVFTSPENKRLELKAEGDKFTLLHAKADCPGACDEICFS
jgi:hypothetical protein